MDADRKALRERARRLRRDGLSLNEIARMIGVANTTILCWVRDVELTPEQTAQLQRRWGAHSISKPEARAEARRLRREQGLSIKDICERLGVAKSSVSLWVRDIPLTEAQQERLEQTQIVQRNQLHGARGNYEKHLAIRREYQEEGRAKAREGDGLHQAGCMLYWAEGRKRRNSLEFTNADPDMLQFYMRFLRKSLGVHEDQIRLEINCYTNNGLSESEIVQFWLDKLELTDECLVKPQINRQPKSSHQRGRKLLYGVCKISVHSTQLVMHVLGAIQEYTGIDKPEWVM